MMNIWGMTDIGLVRKENQDAYAVRCIGETGHTVAVVCDGMGGPKGGRLASTLAVETFLDTCCSNLRKGMDDQAIRQVVEFAVTRANSAIYEKAAEEPALRGMGTTLVSAIVWGGNALLSNVGDSRAYLLPVSGEPISRITRDHSLVERLVERGDITAEEARNHPNRNLITRALGPQLASECLSDSYLISLKTGDCLLLCTDGLIETVTDQEMEQEIRHPLARNTCMDRLLAIAKSRGAADNVTAVLLEQQ